jgi:hypothetical protein
MSHFYKTLVDTLDQDWHHLVQVNLPPESSDFTEEVIEWTARYWYRRFAANHHIQINLRPEFEPSLEAASIILIRIANRAFAKMSQRILKLGLCLLSRKPHLKRMTTTEGSRWQAKSEHSIIYSWSLVPFSSGELAESVWLNVLRRCLVFNDSLNIYT